MAVPCGAPASWPLLSTVACARAPQSRKLQSPGNRWAVRPAGAGRSRAPRSRCALPVGAGRLWAAGKRSGGEGGRRRRVREERAPALAAPLAPLSWDVPQWHRLLSFLLS
nr:uncharacterized protein LOC129526767 [Gorilla gorilla gorilla]